jgi:hypothetical protein
MNQMIEMGQSDDFFIPAFFLELPPKPENRESYTQLDDFLRNSCGWVCTCPLDECVE